MTANTDALWRQAQQFLARDESMRAQASLGELLKQDQTNTNAWMLLSAIAYAEGRLRDSARHAVNASSHPFKDATALSHAVMALLRVGEVTAAKRCLQDPLIAHCRDGQLLSKFASAEQMIGNYAEALRLLDRAIATGFDNPDIRYLRSVQLTFNGATAEAEAELENCLRMGTTYGRAALTLARLKKQTADQNHIAFIRQKLVSVTPGSEDHAAFEFALYKELEDLGEFPEAWAALERGNALMRQRLPHDAARQSKLVDELIGRTNGVDASTAGTADGAQPIFIVGMPRSGTTLLDRMLGNHSQVTSAGELGDFGRQVLWSANHVSPLPIDEMLLSRMDRLDFTEIGRRYLEQTQWRAQGAPFFIDKLPLNYLWIGLIAQALPNARIVHLVRDPMDVCFSNYRAYFGAGHTYSYDLDSLREHYLDYRKLMAHWHSLMPCRVLDVEYRQLTSEPETTMRQVLQFCGLAFERECLDINSNHTPVATLSAMQVREGIRRDAFDEWRRYESHLAQVNALLS